METIIKLNASELSGELLDRIKVFIGDREDVDIIISLKETGTAYIESLTRSIEQAEAGETVFFAMDEFMQYTPARS